MSDDCVLVSVHRIGLRVPPTIPEQTCSSASKRIFNQEFEAVSKGSLDWIVQRDPKLLSALDWNIFQFGYYT